MTFLFLANGFEEIEALAVVDVFRRAELPIRTISIHDTLLVTGAHNITVKADALLSEADCSEAELLILPGGMPGTENLYESLELRKILIKHTSSKKLTAAICAAPIVLGRNGILKGHTATCYPSFENQLSGATHSEDRVVVSENIITSKGPGSAVEFGLKLVEILRGAETAKSVADGMICR